MTNTTKTATNRRGNVMDGRAIIRDSKRSVKPVRTQHQTSQIKDIALAILTVSLLWLASWTWYFAVS